MWNESFGVGIYMLIKRVPMSYGQMDDQEDFGTQVSQWRRKQEHNSI